MKSITGAGGLWRTRCCNAARVGYTALRVWRSSGVAALAFLTTLAVWPPRTAGAQTGAAAAPSGDVGSFVVRPGEVLRIRVWPDTALGGEFPVEESGLVYLPILGALQAGGLELAELRKTLREGYGAAMKAPVVTVTPLFRVSVLGAVQRPGLYQVDPSQTLFDVISLAGGSGSGPSRTAFA